MKPLIFFLICGILGFASATVILSSNGSVVPQAYGELSYRGYDFLQVVNEDGSYSKTIGLQPFIYNNVTNTFVPFINNGLITETEHGSVILNNGVYEFYPNGRIDDTPKFTDEIRAKYADITNLNSWTYLGQINNAVPNDTWTGNSFVTSKSKSGIGLMEYKYILDNGKWKTQLEATNLTPLTSKVFGFDQIINLNSDSIKFGGVTRNLDNFDGVTFDKQFLENNEGKVLDLLNGFYFDFDLGFEDLHSVTVYDTGVNSSQLVFDYRLDTVLLPNETLIIDPTYYNSNNSFHRWTDTATTATDCTTTFFSVVTSTERIYKNKYPDNSSCNWPSYTFDISGIPDTAVITDVDLIFDIDIAEAAETCDITDIDAVVGDYPTVSGSTILSALLGGVDYVSNSTFCQTTGNDKSEDLGATADSDLQSRLTDDEFSVGFKFYDTIARPSTGNDYIGLSDVRLSVTYNAAPDPPKQVTPTLYPLDVTLSWSAGATNGDTHQTFEVERLNIDGVTWDELTSTTSTTYTDNSPITNDTTKYRIWDTGALGRGCSQFAMNSTIVDGLFVHFPWCYTMNNQGSHTLGVTPTAYDSELYANNTRIGFDFDGVNFIDTVGDSDDFNFLHNGTKNSFGAWIKRDAVGVATGSQVIFETINGGTSTNTGGYWYISASGSMIYQVGNGTAGNFVNVCNAGAQVPADSTWYHIFWTHDPNLGSAQTKMYKNGVFQISCNNNHNNYNTANHSITMNIGDWGGGADGDYTWNGQMADMMFIKGVVVTADDVLNIYNERISLINPTSVATVPSLVVYPEGTSTTDLNAEWDNCGVTSPTGGRVQRAPSVGGAFSVVSPDSGNGGYYNDTGLVVNTYYNYKINCFNSTHVSAESNTYSMTTYHLPDVVDDLVVTTNEFLQFLLTWSVPDTLYGYLSGYMINYTTPAGDPTTIYIADTGSATTSRTISGFDPTTEHSFRVSAVTTHGSNVTGANIANATLTNEIEIGDITIATETNPDAQQITYELFNVNTTTDTVQVQFDSALTLDCTVSFRQAGTNTNYTSISETSGGTFVYHNFTVTNAGNDILDFDCWDQTDNTINGQYTLSQFLASSTTGGLSNVPLFSQIANMNNDVYGVGSSFGGIDLMTMLIVIVGMIGFNRTHPALGVGVMTTMLAMAWYFELIPWTSGMLGAVAMVMVLAIGMGLKKRD